MGINPLFENHPPPHFLKSHIPPPAPPPYLQIRHPKFSLLTEMQL